jgi:RimJ/RimL family protein N-acetyltransferase
VILRALDPADADALFVASHRPDGDPGIWTNLSTGPYEDVEQMRSDLTVAATSEDPLFFTLIPVITRRPLGVASYLRITPDHGVIEIGNIWFGPALQRTVAATEAIYLLARHALEELGYRRLEWKCNALNAPSRAAAQRFGFTFEGIFAKHMVVKGRNRDTAWYAITVEEWPAIRAGFDTWLADSNFDADGLQKRSLRALIAGALPA